MFRNAISQTSSPSQWVAIALPSYQRYLARGIRSQGQQFLIDLAQRQEQYFLDQRAYAASLGVLGMTVPVDVAAKYQAPAFTLTAGPPPTFRISMAPIGGGTMAADGTLLINNLQVRWREVDGNNTYDAPPKDCRWEETRCKPS